MAVVIDKKYQDFVPFSLSNVKVEWSKLLTPDDYRGGCTYKVNILLDDETADALFEQGFNVREKDGKRFITAKKNGKDKHGNDAKPPQVVGLDGKTQVTEEPGNGSTCNFNLSGKKWDVTDKITCYVSSVQVVDHVAYNGGTGFSAVEAPF